MRMLARGCPEMMMIRRCRGSSGARSSQRTLHRTLHSILPTTPRHGPQPSATDCARLPRARTRGRQARVRVRHAAGSHDLGSWRRCTTRGDHQQRHVELDGCAHAPGHVPSSCTSSPLSIGRWQRHGLYGATCCSGAPARGSGPRPPPRPLRAHVTRVSSARPPPLRVGARPTDAL